MVALQNLPRQLNLCILIHGIQKAKENNLTQLQRVHRVEPNDDEIICHAQYCEATLGFLVFE